MGKMSHLTTTELFSKDEQMFPKFANIKKVKKYILTKQGRQICAKSFVKSNYNILQNEFSR